MAHEYSGMRLEENVILSTESFRIELVRVLLQDTKRVTPITRSRCMSAILWLSGLEDAPQTPEDQRLLDAAKRALQNIRARRANSSPGPNA